MKAFKATPEKETDIILYKFKQRDLSRRKIVLIRQALNLARTAMHDGRKHRFERMAVREHLPDGFTAATFHYLREHR